MALVQAALVSTCLVRMILGDALTYDVGVRAEARGRKADSANADGELEANPKAGISLEGREYTLNTSYFPSLTVPYRDAGIDILHRVSAGGTWRFDPRWYSSLTGFASYGTNNLLLPQQNGADATTARVQPLPAVTSLSYGSASVTVGVGGPTGAATQIAMSVTGFLEGGATAADQAYLPVQRGGTLNLALHSLVGPFDTISTVGEATVTRFQGGVVDTVAQIAERWRHGFTRDLFVSAAVGPAFTAQTRSGVTTWEATLAGDVGLSDRIADPAVTWSVLARAGPLTDRLTQNVYERADGVAALTWNITTGWRASATATAGVVVSGPQSEDKVAIGDGRLAWAEGRLEVGGGVRWTWQGSTRGTTPEVRQWDAYLGVTWKDHGRF